MFFILLIMTFAELFKYKWPFLLWIYMWTHPITVFFPGFPNSFLLGNFITIYITGIWWDLGVLIQMLYLSPVKSQLSIRWWLLLMKFQNHFILLPNLISLGLIVRHGVGSQDIEYLKLYSSRFGREEGLRLLEKTGMYHGPERYTHEHMPIDIMRGEVYRTCRSESNSWVCSDLCSSIFLLS